MWQKILSCGHASIQYEGSIFALGLLLWATRRYVIEDSKFKRDRYLIASSWSLTSTVPSWRYTACKKSSPRPVDPRASIEATMTWFSVEASHVFQSIAKRSVTSCVPTDEELNHHIIHNLFLSTTSTVQFSMSVVNEGNRLLEWSKRSYIIYSNNYTWQVGQVKYIQSGKVQR